MDSDKSQTFSQFSLSLVCALSAAMVTMVTTVGVSMVTTRLVTPTIIPHFLSQGWKLRNQYDTVVADIDDQLSKISNSWRREIKPDLTAKLTLNLFEFVEGGPLIRVNLDHTLLLVLKEVHYVTTPEDIPPSLVSLLEQVGLGIIYTL